MKCLILTSVVSFLLIVSLSVASPEQDDRGIAENIDEDNQGSMVMKSTKAPSEKSEFSAMESDKETASQSGKISDDVYDYIPSSWDIP